MHKIHDDINYIYKAYGLVEHHYQEITQEERVVSVKKKWLPDAVYKQNIVNLPKQEPLDIFIAKDNVNVN